MLVGRPCCRPPMPTIRYRRRHRRGESDAFIAELREDHARDGSCLLAGREGRGCYCGLTRPDGSEDVAEIDRIRVRLGLPA